MIDDSPAVPNVEPELLVATWTPSGELTFCNGAWRSTLGTPETPWMRLPKPDRKRATEAVLEAASGTLVTNFITQAHTQQRDEPLPILLHFVPVHLPDEGDASCIQAVTTSGEVLVEPASWPANQTQRHRLEALGRMTMGIAHDFKNLLSGLVGHVELLREAPKPEDAPLDTALTAFEQVANDGTALIEKLQQFIRQENEIHFEAVDLNGLIEDCVALTQPYWYNEPRREGIEIDIDQQLSELPPIEGSPAELREVFVNLILNAVQAMPEGGTISIRTRTAKNDTVAIDVADTGSGMTAEVREHIFEPLFTTKGDRGTGMGLAVTYGIVQEHDGTIQVDSAPGAGTTFTITLPCAPSDSTPASHTPSEAPVDTEPVRVLVVDDEEMVRSVVRKLLGLKGHTVRPVASGPDALAIVDEFAPDIVFTDFGMPEMNGLELAAALRETHPSLPIVLLTGEARETDDTLDVINAVLDKPFKLDDLQRVIYTLTESSESNGT